MKIHEYQAKEILVKHGIPVPCGSVASTPQEVAAIVKTLKGKIVVKAQVHAGGRGKAGGIKITSSLDQAKQAAETLLGTNLITHQTSPDGVPVRRVLVEEAVDAKKELYLGIVIDGAAQGVVVIASEAGGVEIEEVSVHNPAKILRVEVDPVLGLQPYQGRQLAYELNLPTTLVQPVAKLIADLYQLFETYDCSLAEINPLVISEDGRLIALDAKLNFDDDALFRHPDIQSLYDQDQDDPNEVEARKYGINYVKLKGNVGCIVNGAGLAMATMDVIEAAGASPANFLDIGGGADEEKVAKALKIVLADANVNRVLVNLFGGILRCDVAARGFLIATESMPTSMRPMVVRMLGTNSEEGRRVLSTSRLDITLVNNLGEAAEAIKALGVRT